MERSKKFSRAAVSELSDEQLSRVSFEPNGLSVIGEKFDKDVDEDGDGDATDICKAHRHTSEAGTLKGYSRVQFLDRFPKSDPN